MDTESLKSLAWLMVWGGLFYVMMRYGCGAHMMGHGKHRDAGAAAGGSGKDPVCGMTVDPELAKAAAVRDGKTYYFCSDTCRNKFEQEPAKFIKAGSQEAHHA